jgi:hypothetical protein
MKSLDTTIDLLVVEISEIIEFFFLLLDSDNLSFFSLSNQRLKNNKNKLFFIKVELKKILKNQLYIYNVQVSK